MATNFPTSIDTLTNPTASDPQNNPSHSAQHANANDAIEALEAKVGVTGVGFNPASSSAPASVVLHEDTDNGVNKITVIAPSSIASDKTLTLPDETGTVATQTYSDTYVNTRITDGTFDFVASGMVWSGDAYGSTRGASMTAGVVYIGGVRVSVSAVTSRTFTASKDTYIDVDNTGTITYTEVANNSASPALSAGRVRIGIVVTGASNIANAGSVNQGEENKVLPIASSVAYSVTDSLGNLICPRDPNRKVLGYRQITSNATATTVAQVAGLGLTVIIPTGRKIKITIGTEALQNNTNGQYAQFMIYDGVVGVGTIVGRSSAFFTTSNTPIPAYTSSIISAIGTKTYNVGLSNAGGAGTALMTGSSTAPSLILVELI